MVGRGDRVELILERVAAGAPVSATALAGELGVSASTVRRDLQILADHQLLTRVYGGARPLPVSDELPVRYRTHRHRAEKLRIAATTAALLPRGPLRLGLTGGTTTREVARAVAERVDLTVVTNSLDIAAELGHLPRLRLVVTGGIVRPASGELVGPLVEQTFAGFGVDVAVVGVDGIDDAGLYTYDRREASANAALIASARRVIVVADASKIGRPRSAPTAALDAAHELVTDPGANAAQLARLRAAGLHVTVAG